MPRLLAVFALLFAMFALPSVSSAEMAPEGRGSIALQESAIVVFQASLSAYDHKTEAVSERPSACKSDCHAMIAAASPASPDTPPFNSRPHMTAATLYSAPVDLRPPIS